MENNEKWEAVKRRNKTSILQSVNKFREEANKMKRKMQRFVTVSTAAALSLAMAVLEARRISRSRSSRT